MMTDNPNEPATDAEAVEALAKVLGTVLHRTYIVDISDFGSYKAQAKDAISLMQWEGFEIVRVK